MSERQEASAGPPEADSEVPTILQVLPALGRGGAERGAVDVAVAVVEAGGRSVIASEGGVLERELARCGVEHVTLPLSTKNPFKMHRNVGYLKQVIEHFNVDLVHARSRAPAWSAYAAARQSSVPFVTTFHGTYNLGGEIKWHYNSIMTKGDRVIAISHFIAEHIRAHYPMNPTRLRVIPRGIDLAHFEPSSVSAERVVELAGQWRIPESQPLILLPGRLTRWKGQSLLLDALAQLQDLDFFCAIVGSAEGNWSYRTELKRKIEQLGLGNRVFLRDHCDDMPAAYVLADVVVSASTDPEAFGRVVSEAQAMGCPVVASDHGGAPEQMVAGRTGFLFRNNDAEALAQALRGALRLTQEQRERLAREAMRNVHDRFSKEVMCEDTLEVYAELLDPDNIQRLPAEDAPEGLSA